MSRSAPAVRVNAELQTRLTDAELENVLGHLHPIDCQWCGRPLGDRAPALVVVQLGPETAVAILTHTRCSPPGWRVDGLDWTDPEDAFGTWRAAGAAVAVEAAPDHEEPDRLPALVVNPGMDSIHLSAVDGVWRPDLAIAAWPLESMVDLSIEPVGAQRIRNARVRIHGDQVFIGPERGPERWWAGVDDESFWAGMEARSGLLLILTYSLDPHQMDIGALTAMRAPGAAVAGWIRRS